MHKKSLALKISVLLIIIYGFINMISNFMYSFYVHTPCMFFCLEFPLSINPLTMFIIFLDILPVIPLFIAAALIWREGRLGYWVVNALIFLSFLAAISGALYLVGNLPKLFTEDLLYLTKSPSGTSWVLDNSVEGFASVDSLTAYRVLIIKSFLKAIVEIISCGFLLAVVSDYETLVVDNKPFYKTKYKRLRK